MNIKHPTLFVDETRCKRNIKKMKEKADRHGLSFKPHFKTHQSRIIGEWFKESGITGITVSSIAMAKYFADAGWKDITIAFPANIRACDELNILTQKVDLTVLADNPETINFLNRDVPAGINLLLEIDAGSRRTGVPVNDYQRIADLVKLSKSCGNVRLKGFYSHFGHTYSCRGEDEVVNVFTDSLAAINSMRNTLNFQNYALHLGDTPGCSLSNNFDGVNTITPGNFVFYDVMQESTGTCTFDDIAVALACPVVSKNIVKHQVCIHGGAVHLSKDFIEVEGERIFGRLVKISEDGIGEIIEDAKIIALSQEHGILQVSEERFKKIKVGDVLAVLPVHSCLTAECMGEYKDFNWRQVDHFKK